MKTITKTSKAILFALLAMIICVAMALTACNGNNTPPNNGDDDDDTNATVITKYDATFDASIVMGPMGEQSFASVFSDAYVTKNNNQYSLTVIFTAGELNVGGIKGTIFIDNKPATEETVNGVKDGTIGYYKADGTLVTEGIKVTYSSGDNYALNSAQQNVYYVQSVEFPVDALRATYDLTLYINSNMMGKQFIKDVHDAKITLDLESGEVVNAITGLGVDTLGTVQPAEPKPVEPVADKYTKYSAQLDAIISMGQNVNFTENLFDGVYVIKKDSKYEITLVFNSGEVNMPFGNKMAGFLTNSQCPGYRGGEPFMPVWGYYNEETLVKEGISLTYSSGDEYVTVSEGSYYYVQSMTFAVDSLEEEYILSLCVMAGNETSTSGQQFPYTSSNGTVCNATLTIDLTDAETVNSIDSLLGVDTLGTVTVEPKPVEPVADKYTKYSAQLDSVVSMGQDVNFTENLFEGIYAIKKDNKYEVTLIFKSGEVNMPFGNKMTGFLTSAESVDYGGNTVTPVFGYYKDETLVTDGVALTYSSDTDYVNVDDTNYYYVKSMSFTVDKLEDNYVLSIYVMAGNESSSSSMQFPYTLRSGAVSNAILTIDLTDAETVNSISNLLGVDTLEEAPQPQPENAFTKYDAELSCYVTAMGGVEFGAGLLSGVYVEKDEDQYYMTLIFAKSQVTIMTITCDTFIDTNPANKGTSKGVEDGTIGFYDKNGTLVTEGVGVGYSSGNDYATSSSGNVYYVKSVTMPIDELRETYKLTLYVNSSVMGIQFCEANETVQSGTYSATLTLDLESGTEAENIDDLIGVPVRGEVPDPEYQVAVVSLETSAPLPAVKEAFNTAFGESVTLIVTKDGMKLRIENKHMVINLFNNEFDANVAWIEGANVISTKTEVYSNINGDLTATPTQEEITVPDVFEIAYPSDCNGVLTLTIGVDFMAKMNGKEIDEYSTTVTLTIDVSSLNLDAAE